ncbi:MAG: hypothetical protein GX430_11985, partial [Treponema sp.]|nr:hypothetical protein [Treponema sp.]
TILVDGDDMDEPISDTVRGILDGHIVLERRLAERYQYPAVGVLKSISRLANAVTGPVTQKAMAVIRRLLATYEDSDDMINIGAYVKGTNPAIDEAIGKHEAIREFLVQGIAEKAPITDTLRRLGDIAGVVIPASEIAEYADTGTASVPRPAPPVPSALGAEAVARTGSGMGAADSAADGVTA